jgi:hypothetical protein
LIDSERDGSTKHQSGDAGDGNCRRVSGDELPHDVDRGAATSFDRLAVQVPLQIFAQRGGRRINALAGRGRNAIDRMASRSPRRLLATRAADDTRRGWNATVQRGADLFRTRTRELQRYDLRPATRRAACRADRCPSQSTPARPSSCSGALYSGVSAASSQRVAASPDSGSSSLAIPKSSSFTTPSCVTSTFDGFRSRCTIRFA